MDPSGRGHIDFPRSQSRPIRDAIGLDVDRVQAILSSGNAVEAQDLIESLMNRGAGSTPNLVLTTYAEYLLLRGRPYSVRQALKPALERKPLSSATVLLFARSFAEDGDLEKSLNVVERIANSKDPGAWEAAQYFDELYRLHTDGPDAEKLKPWTSEVRAVLRLPLGTEVGRVSVAHLDGALKLLRGKGPAKWERAINPWGYALGEFCVRRLGARWSWRPTIEDATVVIPTQTASIEISPFLWVRWCLEGDQNQIADLIRAVLAILGVEPRRSSRLTGTDQPFGEQGYSPTAGRGALTEALHAAVALSREGQEIRGLGLIADCPIGRLRVPLVFDGDVDRSTVVLFATETGLDHEFRRSLDMLALSTWGQNPWRLLQPNDVLSQRATDLSIYQDPDSGVRAALVAARFCQSDPAQNARWFVVLTQTLFGLTLNGRPDSLPLVEQLLWDHLRDGGESRWGDLYDDRDALLTLLMSYVGEVLIKRYGGRWGNDRVSGRRFGPTSGLEVADMRYNLGAAVLKSFYQGDEAPMLPGILEYARRAHEQNPTAVD